MLKKAPRTMVVLRYRLKGTSDVVETNADGYKTRVIVDLSDYSFVDLSECDFHEFAIVELPETEEVA
jgi:hypothetical protein